jgi:23S rRNA pseudouridine2605 synthase
MGVWMKDEKPVRVQKAIADRGIASRREAEAWIEEGRVTVNGAPVTLGDKCLPGRDVITVDGNTLPRQEPEKVVLAMNKPRGVVCTNDDPHAKRTVFDLLPPDFAGVRLFCVGRLDKDSEGLLLLTNDGDLKQQLTHPSYNVVKKYAVEIDKPLREPDIRKLIRGIQWEGDRLALEKVFPTGSRTKKNWKQLEVTMHHGKKREIRRLFYAFGYEVKRLQRYQIGQLPLKGIPKGHFKILGKRDIRLLFEPDAAPKTR